MVTPVDMGEISQGHHPKWRDTCKKRLLWEGELVSPRDETPKSLPNAKWSDLKNTHKSNTKGIQQVAFTIYFHIWMQQ